MTATTKTDVSVSVTATRLAGYGAFAAIIASIVNALVRVVATGLLDVPTGFEPIGWGPVINTTVAGVVGATVVYGILTRVTRRPNRYFAWIALIVLLLSFVPLLAPPAFLAGAPWTVLGTLAVMHVTTAAVVLGLFPRTIRATREGVPTG